MHISNKMKMTTLLVVAVLVAGFAFAERVTNAIWSEGFTASDYENNMVKELDGALFANVKAGDVLKVTVDGLAANADEARAEAPLRSLKTTGKFMLANSTEESGVIYQSAEIRGATVVDIEVDATIAQQLQATTIYLSARNLIISKIEVETEAQEVEGLAPGKYYLKNVASGLFWGAGNNWGTQASLVDEYQYVTLAKLEDGKYTMETMVSNGGNSYYFAGDYMDGAATGLDVAKAGDYYTFSLNGNFFGYDGTSTVMGKNLAADSEAALWKVMTEAEVLAEQQAIIASATVNAPANVTFLIKDANFGRNRRDAATVWNNEGGATIGGPNSNTANYSAEAYHKVFNVSQTIENAPKGIYKLTAQGFYRQDGTDEENLPVFYINDEETTIPVRTGTENDMAAAGAAFLNGLYTAEPIYVELTEAGTLTVGTKLAENTNLWCIWDNFQLTYYGSNATIDEVKNGAILTELAELREKAEALKGDVEVAAVKTALDEALAASENVSGTDAINAAIETLKAAIDKAEASVIAKNVLPKMKELVDATNFYTEAALNEYYTQWAEKYEAGTLTKVEATGLQDPSIVTGWHAAITVDNFLLSVWDTNPDFNNAPYYINSWSTEGDSDGSNFRVPFFEYWTNDGESLGEKVLTATLSGIEAGDYDVTAWVRVRIKNGAEAPATGITMQVNEGEAVDVAAGDQVGTSQFYLKEFTAKGTVAEDGVLTLKLNVAADNNISWLSFKNVKYEKSMPKYKVNEVVADQVVRTTTGKAELGSTVKVPYRHYNVLDGKLYSKGVTSKEYNYSFTFNTNGQEENITGYSATGTENIVFLSEGEDIPGLTPCTSANTGIRSSNSASGFAADADVEIVKLSAGTYKLTAAIFDSAKNPDSWWYFLAGNDTIAKLHCTNVNYQELTSEKFTLAAETTIYFAKGGNENRGLDLVYIQAVEAETPVYAYTVNEVIGETVVRTTTGTADKAAVVKVPYRHYNVLDGKLYSKGVTNKEYNYSFTLNNNNQVEELAYDATEIDNVVYLSEGEDIAGLTQITTGNSAIRSSNSAAGYAAEADVEFITLPAGTYKLTAALYDSAKTPDSHFKFKANGEEIIDLNCTNVNYQEQSSEEFTLAGETVLSIAQGGSATQGIDLIYIVKVNGTGISTINATSEQGAVYNLKGQKVQKAAKGLYIQNGKKFIVK